MANPVGPKSAVLYQNPTKTVTLIDIPKSISLAQGALESPNFQELCSSPPLQSPYASTEPKSKVARAKVQSMMGFAGQEFPTEALLDALKQIAHNYSGDWCLPRQMSTSVSTGVGRKRKLSPEATFDAEVQAQEPDLKVVRVRTDGKQEFEPQTQLRLSKSPPYDTATALDIESISHQLVRNSYSTQLPLLITSISQTYIIPPCASFLLSNIDELSFHNFSHAAHEVYPTPSSSAGPGQFDFILLDPPWENRSVRRSRKYNTLRQGTNPMDVLRGVLGKHVAPGALVGCWITNKPSVRDAALEALANWDVNLVEEWAWLKTTMHGNPMSQIDGLWRKPYEILLLGRKRRANTSEREETTDAKVDTQKRVIVACPDLHSRKPNLKELVEPMMPDPLDYRALEVFARNLTARWWSWGNEVLKFNWEGHWSKGH